MHGTVLQQIVVDKRQWITQRQQQQPLSTFQHQLKPTDRDFYLALQKANPALILECKKASPSKGVIRRDFDPVAIASVYADYASVISVLTDEPYFQGQFEFIPQVSAVVTQPVLCKDFIIDPYQVYLARYYQADAILLMLSVLNDAEYQQLASLAEQLGMGILTEVSNEHELQRAIALNAKVVGINNRDLRDLSVDLNKTKQLAPKLPKDTLIISESGIVDNRSLRQLQPYVTGFLIGSSLMASHDLRKAVEKIIDGQHKICGLTRPQDAVAAWSSGARYGGLIFVDRSPRCVSAEQAAILIKAAPLQWVGVFASHPIDRIVTLSRQLGLSAVQLHGDEDRAFVLALREQLPTSTAIWKALTITDSIPDLNWPAVDRYVFDQGKGGSGQPFNWALLTGQPLAKVIIAGGITLDNCQQVAAFPSAALDINSGAESTPGCKDSQRLDAIMTKIAATAMQ